MVILKMTLWIYEKLIEPQDETVEKSLNREKNPSIAWLAKLAYPKTPKEYLLTMAETLLTRSGQITPPFDPRRAIPQSIKRIETVELSRDGMLVPVEGGFIIKLNSQKPLVRQRFVCAHEIGHTYFYDVSGVRPWRPIQSVSSYWAEENLCYQFAEEMLMPKREITRVGGTFLPTIDRFLRTKRIFDVSNEALCRRIARLNLWRCILILLTPNLDPIIMKKKMIVCKNHNYDNYSINWDKIHSLSRKHDTNSDLNNVISSVLSGHELFQRGGKRDQWRVETANISLSPSPKTLVILSPL